jgi:hypothetical protein
MAAIDVGSHSIGSAAVTMERRKMMCSLLISRKNHARFPSKRQSGLIE